MTIVLICLVVVVVALLMMINGLIGKKNQVENALAAVDVQLKRRYDLIPNLVTTVKEYMKHERGVLEDLTALRSKAIAGGLSDKEKSELDGEIVRRVGAIMVQVENYPELKASDNMIFLQRSLNEIEEQLAAARRAANAALTAYNNAVEMVPTCVVAGMLGYQRRELLTATTEERRNPDVKNLFNA